MSRPRIHQVSCSMFSRDTEQDVRRVSMLALKVDRYARRLGFSVMYENVDLGEEGDADSVAGSVPQ